MTNPALNPKKVTTPPASQAIIAQKYGDLEDAFAQILRNQLNPKVNEGKTVYWAIATKVFNDQSVNYSFYDFFRRSSYEIERQDGISDGELSSKHIVMAHVPGLYTLTSTYDQEENKQANKMMPSDIFKVPIETSLKILPGDIIEVVFDSPSTFSNPKILSALAKNDKRLKEAPKRKITIDTKKQVDDVAKCRLLQVSASVGGALDNRIFLNPKAPSTGYFGTYYKAAANYLPAQNLLESIILSIGKTEYVKLLKDDSATSLNEEMLANLSKTFTPRFQFFTPDVGINNAIKMRLANPDFKAVAEATSTIPFEHADLMTLGIESIDSLKPAGANTFDRSLFLLIEIVLWQGTLFKEDNGAHQALLDAAVSYLKNLFKQEFKFGVDERKITTKEAKENGFADTSTFLQLDMMKNVDDAANVKDALEFDSLAYEKNFPQDAEGYFMISPVLKAATGSTKSDTTTADQIIGMKNPLDECEDAEQILKDLYITAKGTETLKYANKRIKKLHKYYEAIKAVDPKETKFNFIPKAIVPKKGKNPLQLLHEDTEFVLSLDLIDYFSRAKKPTAWGRVKSTRPRDSRFTYPTSVKNNEKIEIMGFLPEITAQKKVSGVTKATTTTAVEGTSEEAKKKAAAAKKKKKEPVPPRRTTRDYMFTKSTQLALFCEELKALIAGNETSAKNRIFPEQIIIVPLKTFKPYRRFKAAKKKPGHDQNSRHFYNRAIDFSVFILNKKTKEKINGMKEIPDTDVFQIPSEIVYLYVLKLMKLTNNFKGGLALFTRSENLKTLQYNHYEYMQDVPNKTKVVKSRRWCNEPKEDEKKDLIGKLFGTPDSSKDTTVKKWVAESFKVEALGGPPQKIQFLID